MARRNRGGPPKPKAPAPAPLAARETAADLAADTAGRARRPRRRGATGASPGPFGDTEAPWLASFVLGEARYDDRAFASLGGTSAVVDRWGHFPDRRLRYDLFWSHYEGNVYRAIHRWAAALKTDRELYSYIRTIFSPAYRIGEFWAAHLWGGPLDPEAGDGVNRPSCLPVVLPEGAPRADELRAALAALLGNSLWQTRKDTVTRTGAVKGDVGILVHDDGSSVSLRVVDPSTIAEARRDSRGNVKEYVIQEWRTDPEFDRLAPFLRRQVMYTEWCRRVGDSVVYTTYRDGEKYDWREYAEGTDPADEVGPEWVADYDFVPMVLVQHRDMGKGWGWSELQPDFGKLYELDDLASKLSDQIRKTVDCPVAIAGAAPGDVSVGMDDEDGSGRTSTPTVYLPEGATVSRLIADLDIASVGAHIKAILDDVEKDHPELATDNVGLASSGEARRVAREKVEANVVQRRAPYDDALVRACQMAISIGAIRAKLHRARGDEADGYRPFAAFDEGSYERGELDFAIGPRPVFAVDESDKLALATGRAGVVKAAVDAGLPVAYGLRMAGVAPEEVDEVLEMIADQRNQDDERAVERQRKMMEEGPGIGTGPAPEPGGPAADGTGGPPGEPGVDGADATGAVPGMVQ